MKHPREEYLERLLDDTEKTLDEYEEYQRIVDAEIKHLSEETAKQMLNRFYQETDTPGDYPMDGYAEFTIDPDGLTAYGEFYPPSPGMQALTLESVVNELQTQGIEYGIDRETIESALEACATEQVPKTGIVIARGDPPQAFIPQHIVLEERFTRKPPSDVSEKEQIDYRKISPFILVKKHEHLAHFVPEQPGVMGMAVTSQAIPFREQSVSSIKPGKNTENANGVYIALCDGRLEISEHGFRVNEVLMVQSDVGYKTGNIDFPGDVMISGQVRDNFSIKSGGSVFCEQTLDASQVECHGDLMVKKGIIGRKKGVVKSGGKIMARFLENCYAEARGDISIISGIMHSSVYTSGRVDCKPRGLLIGGTIFAQNGVRAYQIGSSMSPKTEIYCGIDYIVKNKIEWIKSKTLQLAYTLRKVQDQLSRATKETRTRLDQTREKIQLTIRKMNEQAAALVFSLDKNDAAVVEVYGTVYPGVYIEISHIAYVVNRQLSRVRFLLDKNEGRVITQSLS
jgi:uncharacterized protein (DUF342 family)